MKNFFFLALLLVLFSASCTSTNENNTSDQKEIENTKSTFDWLEGEWTRCNGRGLLVTSEIWDITNKDEFKGLGFTLDHGDTIFKENLSFTKIDSSWELTVFGVNNQPTSFKLIDRSATSFHVSNPENKFPTDIQYRINQDTLEALVYNAEEEILFQFTRTK